MFFVYVFVQVDRYFSVTAGALLRDARGVDDATTAEEIEALRSRVRGFSRRHEARSRMLARAAKGQSWRDTLLERSLLQQQRIADFLAVMVCFGRCDLDAWPMRLLSANIILRLEYLLRQKKQTMTRGLPMVMIIQMTMMMETTEAMMGALTI